MATSLISNPPFNLAWTPPQLADAIEAAIEYKEDDAPYVVFSMTNVEVEG